MFADETLDTTPSYEGLPDDFLFGTSTSDHQIAGHRFAEGAGATIWQRYFAEPGQPGFGKDNADIACDHWNRWQEDVRLLHEVLGADTYRFSVGWAKVRPQGRGARLNWKAIDWYKRLIESLRKVGIKPFGTLYHWDMPIELQDAEMGKRGWLDRDVGDYFADYAALIVKHLDGVEDWATVNEPEVIVAGYICDGLAPGYRRPSLGYQAGHNLLVAHGKALQAMRAAGAKSNRYGIVLNFNEVSPSDDSEEAARAARTRWETAYAWYLDALLRAHYPDSVLDRCVQNHWTLDIKPGDMALIAQALDWLGINWYTRFVVDAEGNNVVLPGVARTQMGWEIAPSAFTQTLIRLHQEYKLPPVFITENGAALDDTVAEDGAIHDLGRICYLDEHLRALEQAVIAGVPVRGYSVWSLLDNLEWSLGFDKTFGLVHVDRTTMTRTVKDSGLWYAKVIRKHRIRSSTNF